jgi:hypothetical protein
MRFAGSMDAAPTIRRQVALATMRKDFNVMDPPYKTADFKLCGQALGPANLRSTPKKPVPKIV